MTPADILRAAVQRLRGLAAAAAESSGSDQWEARRRWPTSPDNTSVHLLADGKSFIHGHNRGGPFVAGPVGEYIAAMGPAVGLVLADWLDRVAGSLDSRAHPGWHEAVAPHAFEVARAVLGGGRPGGAASRGTADIKEIVLRYATAGGVRDKGDVLRDLLNELAVALNLPADDTTRFLAEQRDVGGESGASS